MVTVRFFCLPTSRQSGRPPLWTCQFPDWWACFGRRASWCGSQVTLTGPVNQGFHRCSWSCWVFAGQFLSQTCHTAVFLLRCHPSVGNSNCKFSGSQPGLRLLHFLTFHFLHWIVSTTLEFLSLLSAVHLFADWVVQVSSTDYRSRCCCSPALPSYCSLLW